MHLPEPPPPLARPALALWLWERELAWSAVAPIFGVGPEQVRRYCLPFGRALRAIPSPDVMDRIVAYTRGAVPPGSFYEVREVAEAVG